MTRSSCASGDGLSPRAHELGAHQDLGRDVGRKGVADPRRGDRECRAQEVTGAVARPACPQRDVDAPAHHARIVDAAPQVAPIRHVAVLALEPPPRCGAPAPLRVGIFEGLAVERQAVDAELVAARAELRAQECRRAGDAIVREAVARGAVGRRAAPARRTEMLVAAHVAARADDAASLQRWVEVRVGAHDPGAFNELGTLLSDGSVALRARARGGRLPSRHLPELACHAGPHAFRMKRGLPIVELYRVARAASFRLKAALDGRKTRRRRSLGRDDAAPVLLDEIALAGGESAGRQGRVGCVGGQRQDEERHCHELSRPSHGSRAYHAPPAIMRGGGRLVPSESGDTLGALESRVVGRTEASRIPVGLPDFKSGVRL